MPTLALMSISALKEKLEARGAATYGNREQLVERIKSGQKGKIKPGPKPSKTIAKKSATSTKAKQTDKVAKEKVAKKKVAKEKVVKKPVKVAKKPANVAKKPAKVAKTSAEVAKTSGEVRLAAPLTDQQEAQLNLSLVRIDVSPDGIDLFVYSTVVKPAAQAVNPVQSLSNPAKRLRTQASSRKSSGTVRADSDSEEEEDSDSEEDEEMADCEDLIVKRLMKHRPALLVQMLKDHGVPEHAIKGATHEELAEMVAEQETNETDDDDEDM